jgi:2-polyprenyl-3-methyl-5-hydroxy-6-metoxy-1,4-benzoquinol methylase
MNINYLQKNNSIKGKLKNIFDKINYERILKRFERIHNKNKSFNYLEFGPASGQKFTWTAARLGKNIKKAYFVDISKEILDHIKSLNIVKKLDCFYIKESACSKDFIKNHYELRDSFDFIVSSHVIEHLQNPEDHIAIIHKLLKKNAVLYIATPNLDSYGSKTFGREWRGYIDPTHISLMGYSELENMLLKGGFEILEQGTSFNYKKPFTCITDILKFEFTFCSNDSGDATNIICKKS